MRMKAQANNYLLPWEIRDGTGERVRSRVGELVKFGRDWPPVAIQGLLCDAFISLTHNLENGKIFSTSINIILSEVG